jgi:hypothetical protein
MFRLHRCDRAHACSVTRPKFVRILLSETLWPDFGRPRGAVRMRWLRIRCAWCIQFLELRPGAAVEVGPVHGGTIKHRAPDAVQHADGASEKRGREVAVFHADHPNTVLPRSTAKGVWAGQLFKAQTSLCSLSDQVRAVVPLSVRHAGAAEGLKDTLIFLPVDRTDRGYRNWAALFDKSFDGEARI